MNNYRSLALFAAVGSGLLLGLAAASPIWQMPWVGSSGISDWPYKTADGTAWESIVALDAYAQRFSNPVLSDVIIPNVGLAVLCLILGALFGLALGAARSLRKRQTLGQEYSIRPAAVKRPESGEVRP
jgi:hypothetical protein